MMKVQNGSDNFDSVFPSFHFSSVLVFSFFLSSVPTEFIGMQRRYSILRHKLRGSVQIIRIVDLPQLVNWCDRQLRNKCTK